MFWNSIQMSTPTRAPQKSPPQFATIYTWNAHNVIIKLTLKDTSSPPRHGHQTPSSWMSDSLKSLPHSRAALGSCLHFLFTLFVYTPTTTLQRPASRARRHRSRSGLATRTGNTVVGSALTCWWEILIEILFSLFSGWFWKSGWN